MAAATAALCRAVESVLVAMLPAVFVLPMVSGVCLPREVLPDAVGEALLSAPLFSTVDLMRSGCTGEPTTGGGPARPGRRVDRAVRPDRGWPVPLGAPYVRPGQAVA
ncbi:hypothetical protein AB0467_27420 [Streptomyces sp. NPDC052095]|uniref:hypothetical protein n=1 Tax=unclassified Streptomyces TaxID=2593676 RepID=UPI00344FFEB1